MNQTLLRFIRADLPRGDSLEGRRNCAWRTAGLHPTSPVRNLRLSGRVGGKDDPLRAVRAELMCQLFEDGWNIYNHNGDQTITLGNIQEKIRESDAFVFSPQPSLEDIFSAVSVFVGYQTLDPDLVGKPTSLLNTHGSWDRFIHLVENLHEMGTVRQVVRDYFQLAKTPEEVVALIDPDVCWLAPDHGNQIHGGTPGGQIPEVNEPRPDDQRYDVCVFCSASVKDEGLLDDGYQFGRELALSKVGCISGAGRTGIMGSVVRGAAESGGWTAGSNVPHIIQIEGLPDGLSAFWPRPDIYTRMEVMIEESDAFVIMPGGCGTVQELLALLLRKGRKHDTTKAKPIVVFDREMNEGRRFWSPLLDLIRSIDPEMKVQVANTREEILPLIEAEQAAGLRGEEPTRTAS